jgi:hypothetical protein
VYCGIDFPVSALLVAAFGYATACRGDVDASMRHRRTRRFFLHRSEQKRLTKENKGNEEVFKIQLITNLRLLYYRSPVGINRWKHSPNSNPLCSCVRAREW